MSKVSMIQNIKNVTENEVSLEILLCNVNAMQT